MTSQKNVCAEGIVRSSQILNLPKTFFKQRIVCVVNSYPLDSDLSVGLSVIRPLNKKPRRIRIRTHQIKM